MVNTDPRWMNTLARNMSSIDFAIATCIIAMIFFMKYNQREARNKANQYMAVFLGVGFLMLVGFRIFKG